MCADVSKQPQSSQPERSTPQSSGQMSAPRQPADIFENMRQEMNRFLQRFESGWGGAPAGFPMTAFGTTGRSPSLDVRENGDCVTIEVELPGVEEKDVSVTLDGNVLVIKGEKKTERDEKDEDYHICERSYGSFQRSLRLPDAVDEDQVSAEFEKGVLKIVAQKKPGSERNERRIEISSRKE